jgi:hypothetical protein
MYTDGKDYPRFRTSGGVDIIAAQTPQQKASMYVGPEPMNISGIAGIVTTAMTVTNAVFNVTHRPTPGSATGEVTIGTITLPFTGSAIGDCVIKRWSPYKVPAGAEITLTLVTAATVGAAAFNLEAIAVTDAPGNNAKVKLSV